MGLIKKNRPAPDGGDQAYENSEVDRQSAKLSTAVVRDVTEAAPLTSGDKSAGAMTKFI